MAACSLRHTHPIELVWDPEAVQRACVISLGLCPSPSTTHPLHWDHSHTRNGRGPLVPVQASAEPGERRQWEGEPDHRRGTDFVMVPLNDPLRPYCWAVGPLRKAYVMRSVRTERHHVGPEDDPRNIDALSDDEQMDLPAPRPSDRPSWLAPDALPPRKSQPTWLKEGANARKSRQSSSPTSDSDGGSGADFERDDDFAGTPTACLEDAEGPPAKTQPKAKRSRLLSVLGMG